MFAASFISVCPLISVGAVLSVPINNAIAAFVSTRFGGTAKSLTVLFALLTNTLYWVPFTVEYKKKK